MKVAFTIPVSLLFFLLFAQYANSQVRHQNGNYADQKLDTLCECKARLHEYKGQFVPSLKSFAEYEKFSKVSAWRLIGEQGYYNKLYVDNMTFDVGHRETFFLFSLVSYPPVRVQHPKGAYTLNFNPCEPGSKVHELPIALNISKALIARDPQYDPAQFDHSAEAYYDVLSSVSEQSDQELLKNRIYELVEFTDEDAYANLNAFFAKLAAHYHIPIKKVTNENYTDYTIGDAIELLNKANADLRSLLLREFIKESDDHHVASEDEKRKLHSLFSRYFNSLDIDRIEDDFLKPQYRLVLPETKFIGVEIKASHLRQWDEVKKKALVDTSGKFCEASVLLYVKNPMYTSNSDQWTIKASHACLKTSEIGSSGVLMNFSMAHLISNISYDALVGLDRRNYPLFIVDTNAKFNGLYEQLNSQYVYDTLISKFEGLYMPEAQLQIPYRKTNIQSSLKEALLNNFMLCGRMEFKVVKKGKALRIYPTPDQKTMRFNLEELSSQLINTGFELGKWEWTPSNTLLKDQTKINSHVKDTIESWTVSCDFKKLSPR